MEESASWDLTRDIEEGVSCTPDKSVLSCGRVIGISGLQSAAAKGSQEGAGDDIGSWVDEVGYPFPPGLFSYLDFLLTKGTKVNTTYHPVI